MSIQGWNKRLHDNASGSNRYVLGVMGAPAVFRQDPMQTAPCEPTLFVFRARAQGAGSDKGRRQDIRRQRRRRVFDLDGMVVVAVFDPCI
jgi:hypothetical protein